ncbi:MAG: hypothetical protein D4R90_01400 [Nitrosopumilales archaeon]|nr:MAG: hypothetical protein D4R90_01400 [Nitrosopumilales archaeon]
MNDDRTRCKRCYITKRKLGWRIFKKNKVLLGFVAFVWAYTVFPIPLIKGIDPAFYWISLGVAIMIMIPISLAMFFWSREPPVSDLK